MLLSLLLLLMMMLMMMMIMMVMINKNNKCIGQDTETEIDRNRQKQTDKQCKLINSTWLAQNPVPRVLVDDVNQPQMHRPHRAVHEQRAAHAQHNLLVSEKPPGQRSSGAQRVEAIVCIVWHGLWRIGNNKRRVGACRLDALAPRMPAKPAVKVAEPFLCVGVVIE